MITFIEISDGLTDAYYQVLQSGEIIGGILPAGISDTFIYRSHLDKGSESALLIGLDMAKEYATLFCCKL
jgi:hypothetical protein